MWARPAILRSSVKQAKPSWISPGGNRASANNAEATGQIMGRAELARTQYLLTTRHNPTLNGS